MVTRLHLDQRLREGCLLSTWAGSLFLLIALLSYHPVDPGWSNMVNHQHILNWGGKVGAWLSDFFLCLFGYLAYLFPLMLSYGAWLFYRRQENPPSLPALKTIFLLFRVLGFLLILGAGTGLASIHLSISSQYFPSNAGGILGNVIGLGMSESFNNAGATLILLALLLIGITLFTGLSWLWLSEKIGGITLKLMQSVLRKSIERVTEKSSVEERISPELTMDRSEILNKISGLKSPIGQTSGVKPKIVTPTIPSKEDFVIDLSLSPEQLKILPKLALLDSPAEKVNIEFNNKALEECSQQVEMRLADFGVESKVVAVHPGPVVTRYELELAAGTKVSKITGLVKDLARSLSVISVRVVEVIPGKSVIGLEIPNDKRQVVTLYEVLATKQFQNSRSALTLALGNDISGNPVIVDLAKMPHLLVAGTTGSGKSVSLNAMLLSLLYKSTPEQLRLILIDPKMLELAVYEGIPHLLAPVVTDMKDAASALRWCVVEMERRYRLMSALGVRNIAGYNEKIQEAAQRGKPIADPLQPSDQEPKFLEELPKIVVLADEFADMMVVVGKKVETLIVRLAQKARAAGIHLIFATQRPSVDVITGLIKANIPTRISFQVSSKIDSRTILDQQGAEQLLGNGDMLYLAPGAGIPVRVHGAYVSDDEVHRVVNSLKESGKPCYLSSVFDETAGQDTTGYTDAVFSDGDVDGERDPLYDEAVEMVVKAQRVSVSSIQRRFKIGYNRSARIVEAMEMAGVVSTMETNGTREVLVPAVPENE